MPECQYHQELDSRLRECESVKVFTIENGKKIDTLFTYHDELKRLLSDTRETMIDLRQNQHSWAGEILGQLNSISKSLNSHIEENGELKEKVDNLRSEYDEFAWFRKKMNTIKDSLPWFIVKGFFILIIVTMLSLLLSWEVVVRILSLFKG